MHQSVDKFQEPKLQYIYIIITKKKYSRKNSQISTTAVPQIVMPLQSQVYRMREYQDMYIPNDKRPYIASSCFFFLFSTYFRYRLQFCFARYSIFLVLYNIGYLLAEGQTDLSLVIALENRASYFALCKSILKMLSFPLFIYFVHYTTQETLRISWVFLFSHIRLVSVKIIQVRLGIFFFLVFFFAFSGIYFDCGLQFVGQCYNRMFMFYSNYSLCLRV